MPYCGSSALDGSLLSPEALSSHPMASKMSESRVTRRMGLSLKCHSDVMAVRNEICDAVDLCKSFMQRPEVVRVLENFMIPSGLTEAHLDCWLINENKNPELPGDKVRVWVHGMQWNCDILDVSQFHKNFVLYLHFPSS